MFSVTVVYFKIYNQGSSPCYSIQDLKYKTKKGMVMVMWYGDKRESMVNLSIALSYEGWKVYGFSPNESDSMTDYYCPAWWQGLATKNGFTLVVDNATTSYSGYQVTETRYTGNKLSKDINDKIEKLRNMTVSRGASVQEEETALKSIQKLLDRKEEGKEVKIIDTYPTFKNGNPDNYNWHIEDKNGIIIAMGTGVFQFSSMPQNWDFETRKCRDGYYRGYRDEEPVSYQDSYLQDEDKVKTVDKFYKLVDKINLAIVNPKSCMIKKETIKNIEVTKPVEVSRKNIQLNDILTFSYHGHYWIVTDIYTNSKGTTCYTYEILGSEKRGYQRVKNGKSYYQTESQINKGIEEGKIKIHTMQTVTEQETIIKWVKEKYINTSKVDTTNMIASSEVAEVTPEQPQTEVKEAVTQSNETIQELIKDSTIKEDTDTRDNSKIYVVKVNRTLTKEEYIQVNKYMKSLSGYYSKFKHGFIFKENPINLLNLDVTEQPQDMQEAQANNTKQEQKKEEVKEPLKVNINFNKEKKGIELKFENKPSEEVVQAIKEYGFKWFSSLKIWIAQDTPERHNFVNDYFNEQLKESA
jgi:hypothetical protein